jgi:hypothetical protein
MKLTLIEVDETLPINPDKSGKLPLLNRDLVWDGLLLKVYDAKPFVPLMTKCIVTKEMDNGIVRDIVFDGMVLKERIIFYPKEKVEFVRVGFGDEMGTIWNEILEDQDGELSLRFAFELEVKNLSLHEEKIYREKRAVGYLNAVQATIDHLIKLAGAGSL